MKKIILGAAIGFCVAATASYFDFQSMRTTISGKDCIVVKSSQRSGKYGIGVSYNW